MSDSEFVDYYEVLQSSPNASTQALEGLFTVFAKIYHPDVAGTGDKEKFDQIVEAFTVLHEPEARRLYDVQHATFSKSGQKPAASSFSVDDDHGARLVLLKVYYDRRCADMKSPGLGSGGIVKEFAEPPPKLDFHLWYLVEKGWVMRQDGGKLAISVAGIDQLEAAKAA